MPRLFVAVWPNAEVSRHVRDIPRDGWTGVRWIPEQNWHVTLRFLGEADLDEATRALTGEVFPAAVGEISSRLTTLGSRSVVVPVSGLDDLAGAVSRATTGISEPSDEVGDERFRGHLTVGRAVGRGRIRHAAEPSRPASTVRFDVSEIALVTSQLTARGAVYETAATFATDPTGPHR